MEAAARRLKAIQSHLTNSQRTTFEGSEDVLEAAGLTGCFSDEVNAKRLDIARGLATQADLISQSYEQDKFPREVVGLLKSLDIIGLDSPAYGVRAQHLIEKSAVIFEVAKVDASVATFIAVQHGLTINSIAHLASEEQKAKYLPPLAKLEKIGAWALSEPDFGSDASALEVSATPVEGGYSINGYKKWIGNASISDVHVLFARHSQTNQVIGFIVETRSPGLTVTDIKHKLPLRIVRNGLIEYKNVYVPSANLLEKAKDFASGPNLILTLSRLSIIWLTLGVIASAYQNTVRVLKSHPLNSTHLPVVRAKLNQILGIFKGNFLMTLNQTNLFSQGRISVGNVSLVKGEVTRAGREAVRIASELLQENGLELDSITIKALADMEVAQTYEGAYDINVLVAGRDLTGLASIKAPFSLR
jgi:acyl-CoA oxidase